jgi:hypothetical protein
MEPFELIVKEWRQRINVETQVQEFIHLYEATGRPELSARTDELETTLEAPTSNDFHATFIARNALGSFLHHFLYLATMHAPVSVVIGEGYKFWPWIIAAVRVFSRRESCSSSRDAPNSGNSSILRLVESPAAEFAGSGT